MSKLTGLFENLTNLETITVEEINNFLKIKIEAHLLENFLGNRILYPQSTPVRPEEMEWDYGIIKAYIKKYWQYFYQPQENKLVIPFEFKNRFGSLSSIALIFVEVLKLTGVTQIYVNQNKSLTLIGSVVTIETSSASTTETININNKEVKIKPGSTLNLPVAESRIKIQVLNKPEIVAYGGEIGVIIDLKVNGQQQQ